MTKCKHILTRKQSQSSTMSSLCSICHDDFTPESVCTITKCNHTFHTLCLDKWLTKNITCPYCREQIAEEQPLRLEQQKKVMDKLLAVIYMLFIMKDDNAAWIHDMQYYIIHILEEQYNDDIVKMSQIPYTTLAQEIIPVVYPSMTDYLRTLQTEDKSLIISIENVIRHTVEHCRLVMARL